MRTINRHFTHMLEGYQAILRFEEQFRQAWESACLAVEQQHAQRLDGYRLQVARWQQARQAIDERHQRAHDAWSAKEAPTRAAYDRALVLWKKRRQAALRHSRLQLEMTREEHNRNRILFWAAAALSLLIVPAPLTVPLAIYFYRNYGQSRDRLLRLIGRRNSIDAIPDPPYQPQSPEPIRAAYPDRPAPPSRPDLPEPASMVERWWELLAKDPPSVVNPRLAREGDAGEARLMDALDQTLSDDFIAIRGALVEYQMDADVIVIGRNGIWILDSKYVTGTITYGPKGWTQEKENYVKDGRDERETTQVALEDLAAQWEREKKWVEITLKKNIIDFRLPLVGGIAFTYPGATLDIGDDCPIRCYTEEGWAKQIDSIPDVMPFSELDLVKCAHYILDYSHRMERDQTASALALAEQLNAEYNDDLRRMRA